MTKFSVEEREAYKLEWMGSVGENKLTEYIKNVGSFFFSGMALIVSLVALSNTADIIVNIQGIKEVIFMISIMMLVFIGLLLRDTRQQNKGEYILYIIDRYEKQDCQTRDRKE